MLTVKEPSYQCFLKHLRRNGSLAQQLNSIYRKEIKELSFHIDRKWFIRSPKVSIRHPTMYIRLLVLYEFSYFRLAFRTTKKKLFEIHEYTMWLLGNSKA